MAIPTYRELPAVISGYPLNPQKGYFSVVIPEESRNFIPVSTFEYSGDQPTVWGQVAGTFSVTGEEKIHGNLSMKFVATGSGEGYVRCTLVQSLSTGLWTSSFWFKGIKGATYSARTTTSTAVTFVAEGVWQYVVLTHNLTAPSGFFDIVKPNGVANSPFYVDAIQIEDKTYATTFIDGSYKGNTFNGYSWNGSPYQSMSYRSAQEATGGRVVNLDSFGFKLIGVIGGGLSSIQHNTLDVATGGSVYQSSVYRDKSLSLVGTFTSDSSEQRFRDRQALYNALRPDRVYPPQPTTFHYTLYSNLDAKSSTVSFEALYDGGLEGSFDNHYQERVSINLRLTSPSFRQINSGGALLSGTQGFSAYPSGFMRETVDGVITDTGISLQGNARIDGFLELDNDRLLVYGDFLNAGGDANADYAFIYSPILGTVLALTGGPLNGRVRTAIKLPDGRLVLGGDFTNAGDANGDYVCIYNLSTPGFSALVSANPLNARVRTLAYQPTIGVLIGGEFTDAGAFTEADYLCRWIVSSSPTGFARVNTTALNNFVYHLIVLDNLEVLVLGTFTDAGSDANADYICRVNGSAYPFPYSSISAMTLDASTAGVVGGVKISRNTILFGGRLLTTPVNKTGLWTGYAFQQAGYPLGSTASTGVADNFNSFHDREYVATGDFSGLMGYASLPGTMARWRGTNWVQGYFGYATTGSAISVYDAYTAKSRSSYYGILSGNPTAAMKSITVNYPGTYKTYPTIRITGPSRPFFIENRTLNQGIYLRGVINNSPIESDEVVIIKCGPGGYVESSVHGRVSDALLAGSSFELQLKPGNNVLNVFVKLDAATGVWQNDGGGQLGDPMLTGITAANTDGGILRVSIVDLGGGSRRLDFYKDAARAVLVAQSATYTGTGPVAVSQSNNSGISGSVVIAAVGAADTDIQGKFPLVDMLFDIHHDDLESVVV